MRGRMYSPSDEARGLQALAECDGNTSEAARVTGYPRTTITGWAQRSGMKGTVVTEDGKTIERKGTAEDKDAAVADWKRGRDLNLAELFDAQKVKKASLYHNTIAAGTAQDKILVLSGKPSGIFGLKMDLATFLTTKGDDEAISLPDGNTLEGEVVPTEDAKLP